MLEMAMTFSDATPPVRQIWPYLVLLWMLLSKKSRNLLTDVVLGTVALLSSSSYKWKGQAINLTNPETGIRWTMTGLAWLIAHRIWYYSILAIADCYRTVRAPSSWTWKGRWCLGTVFLFDFIYSCLSQLDLATSLLVPSAVDVIGAVQVQRRSLQPAHQSGSNTVLELARQGDLFDIEGVPMYEKAVIDTFKFGLQKLECIQQCWGRSTWRYLSQI